MNLAAYARTSTQDGAGSDSLSAQEDVCRRWADESGHTVVVAFRDDALFGGLGIDERPGLTAALLAIEDGSVDGVVVHRVDRLARELHVQEVALAHAWSAGPHVSVFEAAEGGEIKRDDPNDPHRRFLRQVMGAAAELERGLIRARLQGGRRRKASKGGYVGGKRLHRRYGYTLVDGEYVPNPDEHVVIDRIVSLRDESRGRYAVTWEAIAAMFNDEGIAPPSGKAWYPATAMRIYEREVAIQS